MSNQGQQIIKKTIEQVMHESMMPYSEYVIMDRALPRVEDGLKPVQRRVIYSMLEVGVTPDKPFRKSATIVGDCMGKYHPHGNTSIYDTMVRMAQDFNMREVLVNGHGNYGSVDGDVAAAMRYTEARLAPLALELLKDLEKDTVNWSFNYDDSRKEPDTLPGRFPNLLVNGSTGIAVGLATNIPTHNLAEAIDATVAYIDNNKITLDEIMQYMPAPDFSTGGYVLSNSETRQVYETGRGKIIMRAKTHIEEGMYGTKNIVITEIPYQVNKAQMLMKIAKLKELDEPGIFQGIIDIVDESDRTGTRAVIKVSKDVKIDKLLRALYKSSDLQINFNANIVAIAGGKPKQMSLLEILDYYVKYQRDVIVRRTKYDLEVSKKRAHILEGLVIAINNIDEVIKIIKQSASTGAAKIALMERFLLSEIQAQAILDMRLARLTNLEVYKLQQELAELLLLIEKLEKILASEKLQYKVVKTEMLEIKKKYGSPRRSAILDVTKELEDEAKQELVTNSKSKVISDEPEPVVVVYSAGGAIKAVPAQNYKLSQKAMTDTSTVFDIPHINLKTNNAKKIVIFTNLGNAHTIRVGDLPLLKFKEKGELMPNVIKNFEVNEKVVAIFEFNEQNSDKTLFFATKQSMIKTSNVSEFMVSKQTISAIKLKEDDELIYVDYNLSGFSLTMFTKDGMALNFEKDDISVSGRVSMGIRGIMLGKDDYVISTHQVTPSFPFAIFSSSGHAKVIRSTDVITLTRAKKGQRILSAADKHAELVAAYVLDKNTSYVVKGTNNELAYVLNKKMPLEDKNGKGKNVLTTKTKNNKAEVVYQYQIINT